MILLLTKGGQNSVTIAKIFQAHGVWFGQCREPDMIDPDVGLQNSNITGVLEATYGNDHSKFPAHKEKSGFMAKVCDILEMQGYDGKNAFGFMCHGVYKDCFHTFNPFRIALIDPIHTMPCPHLETMPYQINVQNVIDRNFHILKHVFLHSQIPFNEKIANDTLDQAI